MDWLPSVVDPTTVCVGLLILALTLVWAYVMLGSAKQPDLSALYEKEPGPGKRAGKTRPKGRQVEGSLKVSDGNSPKASSAKLSQKKQTKASATTGIKLEEEVGAKGRGKKSKVNTATTEKEPEKSPGDEEEKGEWQTQLSRQQLRALRRQKKEESGGEGDQENLTPPDEATGGVTRMEGGGPSPLVPTNESLPISESLPANDSSPTSKSPSGSNGKDLPKPSSRIVNVEQALKDAARSGSSSPEDTATQSAEPQPTGDKAAWGAVAPQSEDQPSEPAAQEEWVVL